MRVHLDAMWADHDRLVQRVTRAVTREVSSYAVTPSSEVWIGTTRVLEQAARGNPFAPPTEDDRLAAFATGAQGAGAGITPGDLVAAVLFGAREVEADVFERASRAGVPAEVRLRASARARQWAEQMAVWATEGLLGAGRTPATRHVLAERLVLDLRQGAPRALVLEQAAALGLDPQRDHVAVVALGVSGADLAGSTALRLAVPGAIWASEAEPDGRLAVLGLLPRRPPASRELVVGLAGPAPLAETGSALRDAARAARVALRFGRRGVSELGDLGLLVPLHEDPQLAARLRDRWVTPLETVPRHDLVATLRSWVGHEGQVERVAGELAVHPNTVRNRLGRIGTLLGPGWREPAHRAEIWAALQVAT